MYLNMHDHKFTYILDIEKYPHSDSAVVDATPAYIKGNENFYLRVMVGLTP